jgi:hypothetical protein
MKLKGVGKSLEEETQYRYLQISKAKGNIKTFQTLNA